MGSLAAFKRGSRAGFLAGYGAFICTDAGCGVSLGLSCPGGVMLRLGCWQCCRSGVCAAWVSGAVLGCWGARGDVGVVMRPMHT